MEAVASLVVGRYRQDKGNPYCIFIRPKSFVDMLTMNIKYDDLKEAIDQYFINKHGFSSDAFLVRNAGNIYRNDSLVAEVTFVDEGIVMAKLLGILE